jgi:hypothetical protein
MNKERRKLPDFVYCHECLNYSFSTGKLTRAVRPRHHFKNNRAWGTMNARDAGKEAGTQVYSGHILVAVGGRQYMAHRIIWHMMIGDIPEGMSIDHINGNSSDNRLQNLRLATHKQNMQNRKNSKRNTSGYRGVYWSKARQKWYAQAYSNSKHIHLGYFDTPELARDAWTAFATKEHGDFYRKVDVA